jgi:hypothetical protein
MGEVQVWTNRVGGGASGFTHGHQQDSAYKRCDTGSGPSSLVRLKKLPGAAPEALFFSSPFRSIRFLLLPDRYLILTEMRTLLEISCKINFGFEKTRYS